MTKKKNPEPEPEAAPELAPAPAPPAAREPDAFWKGLPVWRCRFCRLYERVGEDRLVDVLEHELRQHKPAERPSAIVDPSGDPFVIRDEEE